MPVKQSTSQNYWFSVCVCAFHANHQPKQQQQHFSLVIRCPTLFFFSFLSLHSSTLPPPPPPTSSNGPFRRQVITIGSNKHKQQKSERESAHELLLIIALWSSLAADFRPSHYDLFFTRTAQHFNYEFAETDVCVLYSYSKKERLKR